MHSGGIHTDYRFHWEGFTHSVACCRRTCIVSKHACRSLSRTRPQEKKRLLSNFGGDSVRCASLAHACALSYQCLYACSDMTYTRMLLKRTHHNARNPMPTGASQPSSESKTRHNVWVCACRKAHFKTPKPKSPSRHGSGFALEVCAYALVASGTCTNSHPPLLDISLVHQLASPPPLCTIPLPPSCMHASWLVASQHDLQSLFRVAQIYFGSASRVKG